MRLFFRAHPWPRSSSTNDTLNSAIIYHVFCFVSSDWSDRVCDVRWLRAIYGISSAANRAHWVLLVEHTLFNFRFINFCIVFISGHSIRGRLPRITYRCRPGETKIVQTICTTSCYAIYANNIYVCVCGDRAVITRRVRHIPHSACPHWKSEPEIGLLLVRERQVKMCASCCENAFFGWLWLCKISSYILIYIYITYSMRSVHTKNNNNHRLTILSIYLYFIHCSISISMPFPSVWLQLL